MIDSDVHKQLRQRFNPEGSPLRIHQMKMLKILIDIDKVCKNNGIKYWLSSGSCLGAIRHGGFIPWDDDVDIEMMRSDYIKFVNVFHETDDLVLQTYCNDRFYYSSFGKIRDKSTVVYDSLYKYKGVFVDVFCLEYSSKVTSILSGFMIKLIGHLYSSIKSLRTNRIAFRCLSCLFVTSKLFVFNLCIPFLDLLIYLFRERNLGIHMVEVGLITCVLKRIYSL